jgi:N-acetylglutamate synthase-like GNAT family acetyltransferase
MNEKLHKSIEDYDSGQKAAKTTKMCPSNLQIVEYKAELAPQFKAINQEWISSMFKMEPKDERVLDNPQSAILDGGGHILFVELEGVGIVGTCALLKTGKDEYELTKMGVLASARGQNAGKFLLKAIIAKAKALGAQRLYLLTNKACASAIHLYEAHGFRHSEEIMRDFGSEYSRCDVAMIYQGDSVN